MEQETDVSEPEEERVTRKEATEVALEGLIFGDDGGVYDGLRSFKDLRTLSKSEQLGAAIDLEDHANGQLESLEDVGDEKVVFHMDCLCFGLVGVLISSAAVLS